MVKTETRLCLFQRSEHLVPALLTAGTPAVPSPLEALLQGNASSPGSGMAHTTDLGVGIKYGVNGNTVS